MSFFDRLLPLERLRPSQLGQVIAPRLARVDLRRLRDDLDEIDGGEEALRWICERNGLAWEWKHWDYKQRQRLVEKLQELVEHGVFVLVSTTSFPPAIPAFHKTNGKWQIARGVRSLSPNAYGRFAFHLERGEQEEQERKVWAERNQSVTPEILEAAAASGFRQPTLGPHAENSVVAPNTYGKSITIEGDDEFRKKTIADLDKINATPSGKQLLADLNGSGRTVTIKPASGGNQVTGLTSGAMVKADGTRGAGSDATVHYNPDVTKIGTEAWQDRPPAVGLAHELIHARHATEGSVDVTMVNNDSRPDPADPAKIAQHFKEEVRTVGIEPYATEPYTENKIRSEWKPKQPERPWY